MRLEEEKRERERERVKRDEQTNQKNETGSVCAAKKDQLYFSVRASSLRHSRRFFFSFGRGPERRSTLVVVIRSISGREKLPPAHVNQRGGGRRKKNITHFPKFL